MQIGLNFLKDSWEVKVVIASVAAVLILFLGTALVSNNVASFAAIFVAMLALLKQLPKRKKSEDH